MSALAVGVATYTRHDAHTRHLLDGLRLRLERGTDRDVLAAAYRAERLTGHPLAHVIRDRVEHEVEWRCVTDPRFADWWSASAPLIGGAR